MAEGLTSVDLSRTPGVDLAAHVGPFALCVDADLIRAFAAATNDPSPAVRAAEVVPPALAVTQIWAAQEAGREAAFDAHVFGAMTSGVHGAHDLVLHRALVPGEPLQTWVTGHSARPVGRNAVLTLRYETRDAAGIAVVEQLWTTVLLGTTCAPVGPDLPDHRFPEDSRERLVAEHRVAVDPQMPRRYAEVSGDWSPHHFEVEAARRSGADRPFLHGLCTLSLCAQAVAVTVADGDPARIRRLAVRFAAPAPVGEDITVRIHAADATAFAFEASATGALVITHGRAELRD